MVSEAMALLRELRGSGVVVEARDGTIRVSPRDAVDAQVRARLAAHKAEILAALAAEAQAGPPKLAEDTAELPSWFWRPAETRGSPGKGRMGTQAPSACFACGSSRWWRRIAGGPWVCPVCHPPGPAPHEIEWSSAEVTS